MLALTAPNQIGIKEIGSGLPIPAKGLGQNSSAQPSHISQLQIVRCFPTHYLFRNPMNERTRIIFQCVGGLYIWRISLLIQEERWETKKREIAASVNKRLII